VAKKPESSRRRRKLPETVRERAEKQHEKTHKAPRRKRLGSVTKPVGTLRTISKREYHPIKLKGASPWARFFGKSRRLMPAYFRESWAELRLVKWPNRRETIRLTIAVFIFALIFMVIIHGMDFAFDKLFKEILLS
jgi:preprotein translocase SecE subunit